MYIYIYTYIVSQFHEFLLFARRCAHIKCGLRKIPVVWPYVRFAIARQRKNQTCLGNHMHQVLMKLIWKMLHPSITILCKCGWTLLPHPTPLQKILQRRMTIVCKCHWMLFPHPTPKYLTAHHHHCVQCHWTLLSHPTPNHRTQKTSKRREQFASC